MLWPNTFLLTWTMEWLTELCIKTLCLHGLSVSQASHVPHYGLSIVLSFVTMLPRNIWIPRLFWVNILFDIITLILMILVNLTTLLPTYHIVLKIIQLCQNKDLFYNQPSSFFILGFIKWSQKSGIYCHPKISMPRVSNLPWTLITCGRSGDLSNLVEACPLANIYQNSRSFCGGQYLSQDPSVSALLALPIMRCMCEHSEEVMNTYLLYSNSFSLSSAASSIASNINII